MTNPKPTAPITRQSGVEAMAKAAYEAYWGNPWEIQVPATQEAMRDTQSSALATLESLGLVLTTREVTEAAQVFCDYAMTFRNPSRMAWNLRRAILNAPDLSNPKRETAERN